MIEINLLPEGMKTKFKKSSFELDYLFYLIPLFIGILLLIHLILGAGQILKIAKISGLNKKLLILEPERKKIESSHIAELDSNSKIIEELSSKSIKWSKKLNKLSLYLPAGVWFNEISVSKKELMIKGSVYSLEKKEMDLINKFMQSLRSDTEFLKNFSNLELGSLQSKTIGNYEIVDFIITALLISS
jgi:Tfp pilus assembly protein PilN